MEGFHILGQHEAVEALLLELLLQVVVDIAIVGDTLSCVFAVGLSEGITITFQSLHLPQVFSYAFV
jgi:hypothetical protein